MAGVTVLYADIESYSETPIAHGVHRYAESAEVLLFAFALDDAPVEVWDMTDGSRSLADIQALVDSADQTCWHNSAFDRTVLRHCGVEVPLAGVIDTMVLAYQHALPGALGQLCEVLGVPVDKAKDKDGKRLIHLFTKPRPKNQKLRRATRETHPDDWQSFIEYARRDVDAARSVLGRLPRWNDSNRERHIWELDQKLNNDRGARIDLDLARSALRAFQRASGTLAASAAVLTGGEVTSTTQRQKTLDFLRESHGVETDDLTKKTVDKLLERDLPDEARELLKNRQQAAATSPAKYKVLLNATSSDGRLRGMLQYGGASRTLRDAGRLFQPQNLPRPTMPPHAVHAAIDAMKADCEDLLYDNVSEVCANAVRGCLVAEEGRKLLVSDLSNIEGRVLAWLAGEDWKLEAFSRYDTLLWNPDGSPLMVRNAKGKWEQGRAGPDLYKVTAGRILGKKPEDVTPDERQFQGKTPELAGGFGGSVGAYRKMGGAVFDAMSDEAILLIVRAWRAQHPATVSYWYEVERAFRAAIRNMEETFVARMLQFDCVWHEPSGMNWLRMKLPSGRFLSYPDPQIDANTGTITYLGVNQYTHKWERIETYYGKIIENGTQTVARDVFMTGFIRAEAANYSVVLRNHDELVCEVPDTPEFTTDKLSEMMATRPSWAVGLPLAAAGSSMYRYGKE